VLLDHHGVARHDLTLSRISSVRLTVSLRI
jgi:hypothetical protein